MHSFVFNSTFLSALKPGQTADILTKVYIQTQKHSNNTLRPKLIKTLNWALNATQVAWDMGTETGLIP